MNKKEERILEELHNTREAMYDNEKNEKNFAVLAQKHNERAKDVLRKWHIELPEATYLTQLITK